MSTTDARPTTAVPAGHAPTRTPWRWAAVLGTATAGVLHGLAAVDHLSQQPTLAAAFVGTALLQSGAAGWLALGPRGSGWDTRAVGLVLAGTVVLLLAFVAAHTTTWLGDLHAGAGHGAHATGHATVSQVPVALGSTAPAAPTPAGPLGTATAAAELLGVLGLTALLPPRARSAATSGLLVTGLLVWGAWLTGLLG